jgi:formamidopyrimidine-DNA glycosylase
VIKNCPIKSFVDTLTGRKITDVLRRGKVLIVVLDKGPFLIFHLRISGWLRLASRKEKFCRVSFLLSDKKQLMFCDSRVLGEIKLCDEWQNLSLIKTMGPEPLEISKDEFIALLADKKTAIKPLLMDQSFLAGVGNIYAQEALFCAGIHPKRSAQAISKSEREELYNCLKRILNKAIDVSGSSVNTYRGLDGNEGEYVNLLKVYGRKNAPCPRCKKPIVRAAIGGRGTYFCPQCQK